MKKSLLIITLLLACLTLFLKVSSAEEVKNPGTFSGKMYFDYFHDFSDPAKGPSSGQTNGFEFTRIYFGYDRDLSDKFSIRFLMDADYTSTYALQVANGIWVRTASGTDSVQIPLYSQVETKRGLRPFVKNAYLAMKCGLIPGSSWYFGMVPTPLTSVPESSWGYRSVYRMPMDYNLWGYTADLGIGWKGAWQDMYQVEFNLTNGAGFRYPEADMFKLIAIRPSVFLLDKALTISAYASFETKTKTIDATIISGMAGYDQKWFRVGGEFSMRNLTNATYTGGSLATLKQNNIAVWAIGKPLPKLYVLARYDMYEPNQDVSNDKWSAIIAGVDFHPVKNVKVIPNVQITTYENSAMKSQNLFYLTFEYNW